MAETSNHYWFNQLNQDMIFHILQFMNQEERIMKYSTICKEWRQVCILIPIHYSILSKTQCKLFTLLPYHVNSMKVGNFHWIDELQSVFVNAPMCHLSRLELCGAHESKEIIRLVSASSSSSGGNHHHHLKNLTELIASHGNLDDESIEQLQQASFAPTIKVLKLCGNAIHHIDLHKFPSLTSLDLSRNKLNLECIRNLCQQFTLSNLTQLNLAHNLIGNEGVKQLSNCIHLQFLNELHLDHNKIGNEGAKYLANSPYLEKLRLLFLSLNYITDEGANVLAKSEKLKNVLFVDLSENGHISTHSVLPPKFAF